MSKRFSEYTEHEEAQVLLYLAYYFIPRQHSSIEIMTFVTPWKIS